MNHVIKELGQLISEERKKHNLTKVSLANLTGIHRNTISMIEKGQADFQLSKYLTIFKCLDINVNNIAVILKAFINNK